MPNLRTLLWGGLCLAAAIQLTLLLIVLQQGSQSATGAANPSVGGAASGNAESARTIQAGVYETSSSRLLELQGRGISVALRLAADKKSLWWANATADLEGGSPSGPGKVDGCRTRKIGPELFFIEYPPPVRGGFGSHACEIRSLALEEQRIAATFGCPGGLLLQWELLLRKDQHYARVVVGLTATDGPSSAPGKLTLLEVPSAEKCDVVVATGAVDGSPVVVGKRWFLGAEHPLGLNEPPTGSNEGRRATGVRVTVGHLAGRHWPPRNGTTWRYGAVLGAVGEVSQARRSFLAYLDEVRPPERWRKEMLHYNSWFDMHSWQDDEFFNELRIYSLLKKQDMTEALCIDRIEAFAEGLGRNHSLPMDSYLWDDGWDNPKTLWDFDRARFPNGFSKVAAVAKATGSGTGVWLSPWGGYGTAQKERLKLAKRQGYETNDGGFSLAGPRYFARFRDAVLSMRRDYHVNLFKFDGVAGDPRELSEEMEAMLSLIDEIRRDDAGEGTGNNRTGSNSSKEEKTADPWINLTTGTWPSPFFLLWADSIWRGGGDVGTLRISQLASLTIRQRWIIWRELLVWRNVVTRATFFPLSSLMIHGVVVGLHGEALLRGLHQHNELDLAQEAWSFVGMGLQLQELYLTPTLLEPADWANVAEALKWSRVNLDVLRDSHWVLGDFKELEPYGVASWRPSTPQKPALGFLMLRNPLPQAQKTGTFTLADILELPMRELGLTLHVSVVKSLSDGPAREGCVVGAIHNSTGHCTLEATAKTHALLRKAEVLILEIKPAGKR